MDWAESQKWIARRTGFPEHRIGRRNIAGRQNWCGVGSAITPTFGTTPASSARREGTGYGTTQRVAPAIARLPPPIKISTAEEFKRGKQKPVSSVWGESINESYPIRKKEWRFEGEVGPRAKEYVKQAMGGTYIERHRANLMELGDQLIRSVGEVRGASRRVQEYRFMVGDDLEGAVDGLKHLSPILGAKMQ